MKTKNLRFILAAFTCCMLWGTALAQPTPGKIYRFDNYANSGYSMASTNLTRSSIKATSDTDYSQMWLVETHPSNSNAWTLRNLGNGKYLQHAGTSAFWGFVDENTSATALYYIETDSYCTFNNTNSSGGYTCMHYASSQGGIVGWNSTATASQWTMTEITSVTADDLAANWEELATFYNSTDATMVEGYETTLANLFSDAACTTPIKSLTTEAEIEADTDYKALSAGLQEMVKKVYLGDWAEDNFDTTKDGWNSEYGKRYRVQMIEPHSIAADITSYFGINAHNNMDNPLGIFANTRDIIYIMVEGGIKDGAELWLCHLNGHGQLQPHANYANNGYTQLHEGLNAVPYYSDGNALWLNYIVDTYNPDAEGTARFQNPLSGFPDLKVHIAGGNINGYYNAVGDELWGEPDNDADWDYYRTRATLTDFTVLGNRVTLQFFFNSIVVDGKTYSGMYDLLENVAVPTKPYCYSGTKGTDATWDQYEGMGLSNAVAPINIMVEAWDRIAMSQHATHGFLSTSQIEEMNKKYPRWYDNWTKTGKVYNYGNDLDEDGAADTQTYQEYCGGIDYSEYYNHHCLAISNTSGYMSGGWTSSNYHINTAPSVIGEIAAEAGPTWGPAHEIGHQHQAIFTLNGQTEVTNNLFSNIGVWYMGMATSRLNGSEGSLTSVLDAFNSEDNDTYTNNIWALTHIYYKLWLYYHLAGNNTQFYPRFFEEMRKDPMVKVNAGSGEQQTGSEGLLKMYKHFCTAAGEDLTEFFRAHGFFEVMDNRYVGDYSSSYYTQTQEEINAAIDEVKAKGYEENLAPLFISDATAETTYQHDGVTARAYWDDATESGNNAEMGSYVDFVDETAAASTTELTLSGSTMSVSNASGVGVAILNSDGEIIGFSTMTEFEISDEVAEAIMTGEVQFVSVSSTGETVEATVDLNAMRAAALAEIIATAKSDYIAYTNENYVGWYKSSAVVELQEAITKGEEAIATGAVDSYIVFYELIAAEIEALRANEYAKVAFSPAHTYTFVNKLYPTYSMYMNGTNVKASTGSTNNVWQLEASSTDGAYYIKNTGTSTYVGDVSKSAQVTSTESGSNAYTFNPISNNYWTIYHTAAGEHQYLHCDGSKNIVGWSASEGSQWALKIATIDELAVNTDALQTLVAQTDELLGSMAAVETTYTITAVENLASKLYCNAATTTQAVYSVALTDGDNTTVLHSKWQEGTTSEDGLNYYIRVDMGESASVDNFQFTYKTRNLSGSIHSPTNIQVQVSNDNATYETIRTLTADADGLPRTINTDYTSPVISCNGKSYRYVRLMVMKSSGANGNATDTGKTNSTDGFPIFVLSEFGFNTAVPQYTATVNSEYSSVDNILSLVAAAYEENIDAKYHLSWSDLTNEQTTTEISELQADYNALATAIKTADDAVLNTAKAELLALIEETSAMIEEAGTVTPAVIKDNIHTESSATINDAYRYCTYLTESMLIETYIGVTQAQALYNVATSADDINEAITALTELHNTLDDAMNNVNTDLVDKKNELLELIKQTNALVEEVGVVGTKYVAGKEYDLQNTTSTNPNYIWSNAPHNTAEGNADGYTDGAGIAGLLDEDATTYFHSRWGGTAVNEAHYIAVDLGEGNTVTDFIFWYETRGVGGSPAPSAIEVRAGNDLETMGDEEVLATYTKDADGLPAYTNNGATWTCSGITANEASRYLRFTVTQSAGPGNAKFAEQYFFAMGGFSLAPATIEPAATVNGEFLATQITEALILAASQESDASQAIYDSSADVEAVEAAILALREDYYYLLTAKGLTKTESIEILNSTGTLAGGDTWKNSWSSTATLDGNTALKLTVGANYMQVNADNSENIELYVGSGSTYTLTPAEGYYISAYSFNYRSAGGYGESETVTLTVGEDTYTINASTSTTEFTTVTGAVEPPVYGGTNALTFTLTGANKGIYTDDFVVTLKPIAYCDITYDFKLYGNTLSTETITAAIGGEYPAAQSTFVGYEYTQPTGTVTADETIEVTLGTWSINIGEQLTDEWNTGVWTEMKTLPEGLSGITLENGTAVTTVNEKQMPIYVEAAGCLMVDFNNFLGGNKRLDIVGVELLDTNGDVVTADYHFGYKGHAKSNNVYALDIDAAGLYILRYMVCFQVEANVSNGTMQLSLHTLTDLAMDKTVSFNWGTTSWSNLTTIPSGITDNVTFEDGTAVTEVKYMETYINVEAAGLVTVTYNYTTGNKRLDIVGTDILNKNGDVISSDYHFGYEGNLASNNAYTFAAPEAGIYRVRYMVSFTKSANTSSGTVDVALSSMWTKFYNDYTAAGTLIYNNEEHSEKVGYYSTESLNSFSTTVQNYSNYTAETPVADLYAAILAMEEAEANLEYNLPEEDKFYTLRTVHVGNHHIFANSNNVVKYGNTYYAGTATETSRFVWQFEGTENGSLKLKNVHTQSYSTALSSGSASTLTDNADNAANVTLVWKGSGQAYIKCGDSYSYHCNNGSGAEKNVIGWSTGGGNNIIIEEVTMDNNVPSFSSKVNVGTAKYATVMLGFNVAIPDGVGAYIATSITEGETDYLQLTKLEDVIPANTAVILYADVEETTTYEFKYTTATNSDDLSGNYLDGVLYEKVVGGDGRNYYKLARKSGVVKMYWYYLEYDEDGNKTSANSNDGGYIRCGANKTYMALDAEEAASFSFRFGDWTTGIDELTNAENALDGTIYDLQGRKIEEIKTSGFYIVDGKKVYIKK